MTKKTLELGLGQNTIFDRDVSQIHEKKNVCVCLLSTFCLPLHQ